jgi:hypothetical protein
VTPYGISGAGHSGGVVDGGGVAAVASDGRGYTRTVLADNPVVYYAMQEVGGTAAIDWSGNGNHGTYKGGAAVDYALDPYFFPPIALGRATFMNNNTANTKYVSVPGNVIDVTGGLSFEAWIKSNGWGFNTTFFALSSDAADGTNILLYRSQNAQNLILTVGSTSLTVSAPSLDTGWHHIAVTIPAGGNTASVLYRWRTRRLRHSRGSVARTRNDIGVLAVALRWPQIAISVGS